MAIFTSIAATLLGAIGITSTFAVGLGAAALEVATGVALNLIAKSISGQGSNNTANQFAVSGTLQAGGDIERSFILGFGGTAGSLVYANEWGNVDQTPNAYHTQVICVSDLPLGGSGSSGLLQLFVNGELCTIDWGATPTSQGYPVTEYNKDGKDHLWIKFYDGTQTSADTFLTGTVASSDRPYGSTRVGIGCAYVIATALVNDGLFNGFPSYRFGLKGIKLYDPSKDTTKGGSGSQRDDDPTTWGGDGDDFPAVQIYNIARGMKFDTINRRLNFDDGIWLYGPQNISSARVPADDMIAQITKCRATVTESTGSVATYRSGGEVGVNATVADTLTTLLTTCQGRIIETGGVYKLRLGAPDDPVASFDDGSILSTEEQSFTPFFGLADTINAITAKYPQPASAWNTVVAPPLYNSSYEAEDGNRRLPSDVSLDFVPYDEQVQRLMSSALAEARRARRHTLVLPPEFWTLEPGDVVAWTSTRNGYDNKSFRVDGIVDKSNLDVVVDITEVDPSDYDWNTSTQCQSVPPGVLVISRPSPQPIKDFSVGPALGYDSSGIARKPTISLTWDGDQPDVAYVLWQARQQWDSAVIASGQINDVAAGSGLLPAGPYVSGQTYEVRARYSAWHQARDFEWSDWLAVTVPVVGIRLADFGEDVQAALDYMGAGLRDMLADIEDLKAGVAAQDFANYTDHQELITRLVSQTTYLGQTLTAAYEDAILVATGPDSALAESITTIYTALGGDSSGVNIRFSSSYTPDAGFDARFGLEAYDSVGSAFKAAGLYADVSSTAAQLILIGDQVKIGKSDGTLYSLFDEDGQIVNGTISGPSGASFWNLSNGAFRVST